MVSKGLEGNDEGLKGVADELEEDPDEIRSFDGVGMVRCESETRGDIEMKGVESTVVFESEDTRDEAEMNPDKGKKGPDNESEERSSPGDEGERERETFEACEAIDEGEREALEASEAMNEG